MKKFIKSGTALYPADKIVKIAPNGSTTTTLDVSVDVGTASLVTVQATGQAGKAELLVEEINYGKRVIIDLSLL